MWRVLDKIIALRKGRVLLEYVAYVMSSGSGKAFFGNTRRCSAIVRGVREACTNMQLNPIISLSLSFCLSVFLSFCLSFFVSCSPLSLRLIISLSYAELIELIKAKHVTATENDVRQLLLLRHVDAPRQQRPHDL